MGAKSRTNRRHHPLSVLLYVLSGFALLLVFLPIWDEISEYRVLILVLIVIVFVVMQAIEWRRMRRDRQDRQERWGLRR